MSSVFFQERAFFPLPSPLPITGEGIVGVYSSVLFVFLHSNPKQLRLYGQDNQPISTSQLHALLRFHTLPINVVVFNGLHGKTHLEGGFPLRCFQRLSLPNLATRRCHWRDNRYTRGSSTPVLSYQEQLLSIFLRPRQIGTELSHDVLNPARVPL